MREEDYDTRKLETIIGYTFEDRELLNQSLRHSSFANEHRFRGLGDNERLEYLGDAVLELSASDFLYRNYPDMPEGDMTRLRASLVCEQALAISARDIGLPDFIRLGRGEEMTGGRRRPSIISDALEALIGAIYLDSGLEAAKAFIDRFVLNDIEHKKLSHDSKTLLQEELQKNGRGHEAVYEVVREEGPDHAKTFTVCVKVQGRVLGEGSGPTKKAAEQEAAYLALLKLGAEQHS